MIKISLGRSMMTVAIVAPLIPLALVILPTILPGAEILSNVAYYFPFLEQIFTITAILYPIWLYILSSNINDRIVTKGIKHKIKSSLVALRLSGAYAALTTLSLIIIPLFYRQSSGLDFGPFFGVFEVNYYLSKIMIPLIVIMLLYLNLSKDKKKK